jgi:hypothetical protein
VGAFFGGVGPDSLDEELRRIAPDHPIGGPSSNDLRPMARLPESSANIAEPPAGIRRKRAASVSSCHI